MRSLMEVLPAGWPRMEARPAVGKIRPSRSLIVVLLPDPFGPSSPKTSPRGMDRLRSVQCADLIPAPEVLVHLCQILDLNGVFGCGHVTLGF